MQGIIFLLAFGNVVASRENPLGKVIQLMDDLTAKVTREGESEAKAYKEFVEWCDDVATNKRNEIRTATTAKARLEATIAKSTDDASAAGSKIEELAGSIATDEADLAAATEIRKKEAADFSAEEAELVDSVDTLGRAINIIDREMSKNPAAFTQVDASNVDALVKSISTVVDAASFAIADKQKLVALVQARQNSDDDDVGAPAAASYKSHSSNILDVLEDLKEKAEEQLAALRKAENSAKHNFSMLKSSLEAQIAADNKDMAEQKATQASAQETRATAESELAQTEKDLADGKSNLAEAASNCMQTAADHEATVRSRAEELATIAKAREILVSSTEGAVDQTYSMFQIQNMANFKSNLNNQVVDMVRNLAKEQHSASLAQLASRIASVLKFSTGSDPFVKVRGLISDMITKLEQEAEADATEKAYCDEQMAKTEAKKGELEDDVAKLTSKIDAAASKSARLKSSVKETQGELAALAKTQAEMDRVRSESSAAYRQAKSELEAGLAGVRKALGVLRDYYGSAASMLQQDQPEVPVHSKASGAGNSIIGILEVCESDFAKNLAAEETEEADAASEYDKTTQENTVTKTLKEQDVKYNTQEYQSLDKEISELSADRNSANTELDSVNEYYAKIKERCIAKPESYEARRERRAHEIAGLKEALSILESETALVQRKKRGLRSLLLSRA